MRRMGEEQEAKERVVIYRKTGEEWLSHLHSLIPSVLNKAQRVTNFRGRWKTIISKIQQIPGCLSDLSSHPCFSKNKLCKEQLQSVAKTLNQVMELADLCSTENYEGGKLRMQSNLDALSGKLDLNLRDCMVLIKTGVLGEATLPLYISEETPKISSLKELLGRLQIGHLESKHNALENLIRVMQEDEKMVMALMGRANVAALVKLLTATCTRIREKAATLISVVAESGECQEWLISEGVLPPLVRLIESASVEVEAKEKAAIAIKRLSMREENAREIAGHGGIRALMELCKTGDSVSQAASAAALKNISGVSEMRELLAEEGMVRVSIDVLNHGILLGSRQDMAQCLQNLTAASEALRQAIVSQGGVPSLLAYIDGALPQEPAVTALRNLIPSVSTETWVALNLLPRLAHVLKAGSKAAQQAAASAICRFCCSTERKRLVGESGCVVPEMVKLLESNSNGCREAAAQAIAALVTERKIRRALRKEGKCVTNLVMLLHSNPANTANKYAVPALLGFAGSHKSKKLMVSYGAIGYLKKLSEMQVLGADELLHKLQRRKLGSFFHRL